MAVRGHPDPGEPDDFVSFYRANADGPGISGLEYSLRAARSPSWSTSDGRTTARYAPSPYR
ncbi:MAG: hypothetical protein ABW022_06695 [Actinoplanes sp.]